MAGADGLSPGRVVYRRLVPVVNRTSGGTSAQRVDHIMPEFQHLAVGDTVPDGPPGTAFFTVVALEPQRVLVLYSPTHGIAIVPRSLRNNPKLGFYGDFSWSFILDEVDEKTTRLIVRMRANAGPRLPLLAFRCSCLLISSWLA